MIRRSLPIILLQACGTLLLTGCGNSMVPVEGTVTRGGTPIARVHVRFVPDAAKGTIGSESMGVTDENGHYAIYAFNAQRGLPGGWYKVCLSGPLAKFEALPNFDPALAPSGTAGKEKRSHRMRVNPAYPVHYLVPDARNTPPDSHAPPGFKIIPSTIPLLPERYGSPEKTPLCDIEVRAGNAVHDFDVPEGEGK